MIRFITAWFIALGLQACSVQQAPVHEVSAQLSSSSVAEQQLVDNLNARYQSTVAECANGMPAYYCSGIILRTSTYNASYDFWTHSDAAESLGSVTFSFIRRDVGSNGAGLGSFSDQETALSDGIALGSGFIFSDQETALAQNKAPVVRCIYPFMAGTQNAGRPGFGCGFATTKSANQETDLSTCATLSTPAITAVLWLRNFISYGSNVRNQCSLSTLAANQFKASLEAHNGVDAAHTATRNELLIATWREETPAQLPIEAFFYNYNTASAMGGIVNAQALRHAYYLKTFQRLPIVRVNFSAGDKNIFSWNAEDQYDGWDVANEMNARYNGLTNDCNGQAAYYCNGVLVRVTDYGSSYHSWNPNPANQTDVSFSYLRHDIATPQLAFTGAREQGFVLREADYFSQPGIYPLTVSCSFAFDAATNNRTQAGCGEHPNFLVSSAPCDVQGITTVDGWYAHFMSQPLADYRRYSHQCGFKADRVNFALSIMARARAVSTENSQVNEIMVRRWPQNIPDQLPIEAFFYLYDQGQAPGLTGARFIQRDFYSQTGKFKPVISIALKSGGINIFSYHVSDQGS